MNENSFELKFPSRSSNESFARGVVSAFAAQLDPTLSELSDIKTAVSEAVTNCIVHAYAQSLGDIVIKAKITHGRRLTFSVRDRGCGIEDVELAMRPAYTTSPQGERAGLGFSVMSAFMDSVHVRSRPGHGTTVVMSKDIMPRPDNR